MPKGKPKRCIADRRTIANGEPYEVGISRGSTAFRESKHESWSAELGVIATSSTPQLRSFSGSEMSFTVCATVDGHRVLASVETAKEAFAKAIEWQVAQQFADVAISDGSKNYSIAEFSAKMALAEITVTERSFDSF